MKKDKEWLKEKMKELHKTFQHEYSGYSMDTPERYNAVGKVDGLSHALDLIDQLEEPEQEKVVIPQFVADWIEKCKLKEFTLYGAFRYVAGNVEDWLFDNGFEKERTELISRAWLDGYTVEKEKLYRVILPSGHVMYRYNDNGDLSYAPEKFHKIIDGHCFTEQEIKNLDERYWDFAEEITK